MGYRLQDVLDPTLLQGLLNNFRSAAGAPLSIVDPDGNILAETARDRHGPADEDPSDEGWRCRKSLADSCMNRQDAVFGAFSGGLQGCATEVAAGGRHLASIVAYPFTTGRSETDPSGLRIRHPKNAAAPVVSRNRLAQTLALLRGTLELLCGQNQREELGRAEEYRLMTDHSTDAIVRMSTKGKCLYISPACLRLFGYRGEELVGKNLLSFFHKDDARRFMRSGVLRKLVQNKPASFSFQFLKRDGSYLWVEATGQAIGGADGTVEEIHASIRDITERKIAEENLRRAKEYAEELIDAANAMVLVFDKDNRVVEFNRKAEELTGYTKQDFLGRKWYDVLIPRDRYPSLWEECERQHPVCFPKYVECPIVTKAGEERNIVWSNSPLHENGRRAGAISFGLDISDRVRMEADLRAYQERLGMLLKNLDAVVIQLDLDGTYTLAEGQGLEKIGKTAGDYLGRKIYDLHKDEPELLTAFQRAAAGGRAVAEVGIGGVQFEEIYTPTVGVDGRQNGVIGLAVDITERKRAEQNLHAEKERLRITLQSIGDGVIATDSGGSIVLMNGVAEELTGWSAREAVGRPFTDIFDIYNELTGEKCLNPVERVLSTGNIVGLANHTALRSRNGTVRSVADSAAPILDATRRILGVILVFHDVTEAKKKENEITYLSYHDRLTGLYNRAFLEEETRRLDTARQLPISVIMGDVNGLKLTNDVFGHAEGDNLLIRIAGILRECCRNEDIVARVGGDEFCILLPKTSYTTASDICRRIYARCEKVDYSLPGSGAKLSISLGFATKTNAQDSISSITKAAEDSMYRRKLLESRSQHSFLISSIRTTLFEKSFETEQHAQRLITNSKAIAMALNLPEDQINDIELFALLHDIGKIAIDSHILTKADQLDEEEWAEMRRHPEIGFRIAQASPDLAHIAEYILCHHERWDGTGYPQGLKGTAIPLLARILLVVDAYDAMTQDRVYRKAMTKEEACTELLLHAGTQFDPNIVWVFMEWLEHDYYLA